MTRRLGSTWIGSIAGVGLVTCVAFGVGLALSLPARAVDPVIYAAGDISCSPDERMENQPHECKDRETSDRILGLGDADAVLALGDLQYENGELRNFWNEYDESWGRLARLTFPVLGNHEYNTAGAAGYWEYWKMKFTDIGRDFQPGTRGGGWYAFDRGTWRIYAMNSNCVGRRGRTVRVRCARDSRQHRWLVRDLERHHRTCSLMFMHDPLWDSSGDDFDTPEVEPLIREFWLSGGDVVLAGHAHDYERFAPSGLHRNAKKRARSRGRRFRLFIVGTGGKDLRPLPEQKKPKKKPKKKREPNSELIDNTDFGVLKLRLGRGDYGWHFYSAHDTDGQPLADRKGSERCGPPTF